MQEQKINACTNNVKCAWTGSGFSEMDKQTRMEIVGKIVHNYLCGTQVDALSPVCTETADKCRPEPTYTESLPTDILLSLKYYMQVYR